MTFHKIECGACNLTVEEIPGVKDAREIWNQRKPMAKDMEPVKHGEWVYDGRMFETGCDWFHCSACGNPECDMHARANYCPKCGAKMDGGKKDD